MIYDIAGLRIAIHNRLGYTARFCAEYLSPDQQSPADIAVAVTDEEFYAEKARSSTFTDGYIESVCIYRKICAKMPMLGRMLLHSAVLEYDGAGYAFLGRSGTGKSTHTGLWLKALPTARIVNGDKPILEYKNGEFIAHGTPWRGKEGLGCKSSVPLKALCFLEQAKENSIRRLTASEAAAKTFVQVLMPEDEQNAALTLEIMDKLIQTTPCYLLKCDISQEAVKTSFEMMTGKTFEQ